MASFHHKFPGRSSLSVLVVLLVEITTAAVIHGKSMPVRAALATMAKFTASHRLVQSFDATKHFLKRISVVQCAWVSANNK